MVSVKHDTRFTGINNKMEREKKVVRVLVSFYSSMKFADFVWRKCNFCERKKLIHRESWRKSHTHTFNIQIHAHRSFLISQANERCLDRQHFYAHYNSSMFPNRFQAQHRDTDTRIQCKGTFLSSYPRTCMWIVDVCVCVKWKQLNSLA